MKVDKGWLTLSGENDWHYQSQFVEQDVCRLQGVIGVTNKITLKPRVDVTSVASDFETALHRSRFATKTVSVRAGGGKVILSGTVHSWADRQTAGDTAWAAPGTVSVQDNVMVS